jgi:hypothetical protein
LRACYRGYDEADEVTAAYSLAFSFDGSKVLAGYSKCIRVFDVGRPGRDCSRIVTHKKKQEASIPGEQHEPSAGAYMAAVLGLDPVLW